MSFLTQVCLSQHYTVASGEMNIFMLVASNLKDFRSVFIAKTICQLWWKFVSDFCRYINLYTLINTYSAHGSRQHDITMISAIYHLYADNSYSLCLTLYYIILPYILYHQPITAVARPHVPPSSAVLGRYVFPLCLALSVTDLVCPLHALMIT